MAQGHYPGACHRRAVLEDVAEVEAALDGHLRALERGGEAALRVALMDATPGDPWTFYAWVALACRLDRFATVRAALLEVEGFCDKVSAKDERTAATLRHAVVGALVHHLSDERAESVVRLLREATPHVLAVLATCVGARGWVQAADELRWLAGWTCCYRQHRP